MQLIITKCEGTTDSICLTDEHLHLFINDQYYVDLMQGEHQFLVSYFEGEPIVAWYCDENNIAVDLEVIKFLINLDFVWSKAELASNKCILNVNMHKTCNRLIEEALEAKQ